MFVEQWTQMKRLMRMHAVSHVMQADWAVVASRSLIFDRDHFLLAQTTTASHHSFMSQLPDRRNDSGTFCLYDGLKSTIFLCPRAGNARANIARRNQ